MVATIPASPEPRSRFIPAMIRLRWWVICLWAGLTVSSAVIYLTKFRIDNSVAIWFLEDDPELAHYRQSLDTFGEREWTYLWLRFDSEIGPEILPDLRYLTAAIEQLDHVHRTLGITDHTLVPIESLLPNVDKRVTIVAIQNDNLIREIAPYRVNLIDQIRDQVDDYPSVVDFGLVGTTVVNAELNRAARRDMFVYYFLIAAFVATVGTLVLRYRRDVPVMLAVIVSTVLPVLGIAAAIGFSFNLMTVMLPTLLVTVSVSYLIHFLNEFHLERSLVPDTAAALERTFRRLLLPGFWTSVTTLAGFLSLTSSGVAPVRQVGWFAALGIVLAWMATLTLTPALLSLLWSKPEPLIPPTKRRRHLILLLLPLTRRHPLVSTLLAIAVIAAALGLPHLRADTNYVEFFRSSHRVRTDYEQMRTLGMPQSSIDIEITFPEVSRFTDPDRHRQLLDFEAALLAMPEVKRIESLTGILARMHAEADNGNNPLPNEDDLQSLFDFAISGAMPETVEFATRDGKTIQLRVMTDYLGTTRLGEFRDRMTTLIGKALPTDLRVTLTGTNLLWANMDDQVLRTQLLSIGITSVLVIVILPIVFRSLLIGFLGFLVSFIPIISTLGIMAWADIPVNIATCLLGGVVIGLSVDDTIYFVSRIREALDAGWSLDGALRRAVWSTGRAMIKTSAVLIGGFLTMAASDFMPSVYFGLFFAASIIIALAADLLLLPGLLRLFAPYLPRGTRIPAATEVPALLKEIGE